MARIDVPRSSGTSSASYSGAGVLADRPAASADNASGLYLATDVNGGTVYRSNGSSWVQAAPGVSQVSGLSQIVQWKSGEYYGMAPSPGAAAGATTTQNRLTVVPILVPSGSIDRIKCRVTTAVAGSSFRFAIYDDDGPAGGPGTRIYESGATEMDSTTTGDKEHTPGSAIVVAGPRIWIGIVPHGGAPSFQGWTSATSISQLGVSEKGDVMSTNGVGYRTTGVTGTPPATFPSADVVAAGVDHIRVLVRAV